MIKEFSMHILEIVRQSLNANATEIYVEIDEEPANDLLTIVIGDDGESLKKPIDPRGAISTEDLLTGRKLGSSVPLLDQICSKCGGHLLVNSISSKNGLKEGVKLTAAVQYRHLERPPMGDIISVMQMMIISHSDINFVYVHRYNGKEFRLSTADLKVWLDGVPFETPSVSRWIKEYMVDGLALIMRQGEVV